MRRREGIEDLELRDEIRGLAIGDLVTITLSSGTKPFPGKSLLVRITSIRGETFRGKVTKRSSSAGRPTVPIGSCIAFTAAHIHSLPKGQSTHQR
jgi:hypothetical protein